LFQCSSCFSSSSLVCWLLGWGTNLEKRLFGSRRNLENNHLGVDGDF
jgi:hypothetical protein